VAKDKTHIRKRCAYCSDEFISKSRAQKFCPLKDCGVLYRKQYIKNNKKSNGLPQLKKITSETKEVYHVEHQTLPVLYLKGVGRYCEVCGKQNFRRVDSPYCSNRCKNKANYSKAKDKYSKSGFRCWMKLRLEKEPHPYRELSVQVDKKKIHKFKITPADIDLWKFLEKYDSQRMITQKLETRIVAK
jgi:hypothetical protein